MKKIWISILALLFADLAFAQSNNEFLKSILKNIDQIKSASYNCVLTVGEAKEEVPYLSFQLFYQMYTNPSDKYCGASYMSAPIENKDKYDFCYDGQYTVRLNWEKRNAIIDTLNDGNKKRPHAPFFMKAKSVISYAIENIDSTIIGLEEYNDSTKISFLFEGRRVELGRLVPKEQNVPNENSEYELWIDKKTNLPFYLIRKMAHQKTTERCSNLTIETTDDIEFDALMQIPVDFSIKGLEKRKNTALELDGLNAPNWKLNEVNGKSVSLDELKSKVILLEFTSIGCGPCHLAIPFLKKLADEYKRKDFEIVSMEIVSKNVEALRRYTEKKELNYKYLISDETMKKGYKVQGVPTFFILDEKRVIKKVISGYRKGKTDQEITNSINELL